LHIDLHRQLTGWALTPSQADMHPWLQPLHIQNLFNTLKVFQQYCHDQAKDGTEVNGMHSIARQHQQDTKMLDCPESIEEEMGTSVFSSCFIVGCIVAWTNKPLACMQALDFSFQMQYMQNLQSLTAPPARSLCTPMGSGGSSASTVCIA
jgi:hypothetical protein